MHLNVVKSACVCNRATHRDRLGDRPLEFSLSGILNEWLGTAKAISPFIKPRSLNFSFICDIANMETASLIAASLEDIPTLSSCDLRLSNN